MGKLSIIQQTQIVRLYLRATVQLLKHKRNTGNINHHSPRCIRLIVAKLKAFGTGADRQNLGRSRTVRSIDNIAYVRQDVTHN